MADVKDGGPAFPVHQQWNEWSEMKADYVPKTGPMGGMSLRDYFAAKAMHAELATCGALADPRDALLAGAEEAGREPIDHMAVNAYRMADAMLKAREVIHE